MQIDSRGHNLGCHPYVISDGGGGVSEGALPNAMRKVTKAWWWVLKNGQISVTWMIP